MPDLYSPYIWNLSTIQRILSDEQYIGTYIMRKTVVKELGGKRIKREEKDCIKIPNHHEAIITKETFQQVQKQSSHIKIKSRKKIEYLLKEKVYCGYCYHNLDRRPKKSAVFVCRYSEVDATFPCYNLAILEKELEEIVFQMISKQIEIIINSKQTDSIKIQTTQKIELQKQVKLYQQKKKLFYEQYIEGKLIEQQFSKINLELTKELEPIQNKLEEIDFQLQYSQKRDSFQNQIEKIVKYDFHSLTKELVDIFIDKIYVFKENHIEVKWKIEDFLQKR